MPLGIPDQPNLGKLAPVVTEFIGQLMIEIAPKDRDFDPVTTYLDMVQTSPIIGAGVDVKVLMANSKIGEYTHPDETIQQWVRKNFEQMSGSLNLATAELLSVFPMGYSASEWALKEEGGEYKLDTINILHPRYFRYRGREGKLVDIVERSTGREIFIPYDRIINLVNCRHIAFGSPYGVAECKRVYAAWMAWVIIISEMLIAAQRQATPIIVAQSKSADRVPLCDEYGNPIIDGRTGQPAMIPMSRALAEQLKELENRSVISTDIENKITALNQQTDGAFFIAALELLERYQFLGMLFPETIFASGRSGLGNAGLNSGHMDLLMLSIDSAIDQLTEQLLERIVRPLIFWNFGEQETYGQFERPEVDDEDRLEMLKVLVDGIGRGAFSAADLDVINRMRGLAKIPPVTEIIQGISQNSTYWRSAA